MKRRTFDALRRAQTARLPTALVTDLGTGFQTVVTTGPGTDASLALTQEGDCDLEE